MQKKENISRPYTLPVTPVSMFKLNLQHKKKSSVFLSKFTPVTRLQSNPSSSCPILLGLENCERYWKAPPRGARGFNNSALSAQDLGPLPRIAEAAGAGWLSTTFFFNGHVTVTMLRDYLLNDFSARYAGFCSLVGGGVLILVRVSR